MKRVTIYGSTNCQSCKDAVDFFTKNGFDVIYTDISKDYDAKKYLISQRIMKVPYIILNLDINVFDKEHKFYNFDNETRMKIERLLKDKNNG